MEMLERCKETLDEVVIPADEDVRSGPQTGCF